MTFSVPFCSRLVGSAIEVAVTPTDPDWNRRWCGIRDTCDSRVRHAAALPMEPGPKRRFSLQTCDRATVVNIRIHLRCHEPRGALSCGSPMPRGERIAKPAERDTHAAGPFLRSAPR